MNSNITTYIEELNIVYQTQQEQKQPIVEYFRI
jgi:hypothetical protein